MIEIEQYAHDAAVAAYDVLVDPNIYQKSRNRANRTDVIGTYEQLSHLPEYIGLYVNTRNTSGVDHYISLMVCSTKLAENGVAPAFRFRRHDDFERHPDFQEWVEDWSVADCETRTL